MTVGKSSLLKRLVLGKYPETFLKGVGVTIGYFDQFQDGLNARLTPFDEVHNAYPLMTDTAVRNALAAFEFKGDDVFKKNEDLSGGERARVALCKLVLSGDNFLILDEPTNHLDLYSRAALEDALIRYEGTLFIVSHDRYFINKIADKIVVLKPDETITVTGNYDDYLAFEEKNKISTEAVSETEPEPIKKGKEDYLNKKKLRSDTAKLRTLVSKCEKDIAELECEIESIKNDISQNTSDYTLLNELTKRLEECETELLLKMDEWEAASNNLNQMEKG